MLQLYLSLAKNDDEKSRIEFLYKEYRRLMYNVSFSVLHNKEDAEDAEDAVHEAFLRVIKNISKFKGYSCKENAAYLVITVRGVSLNMLNKRKPYEELDENFPDSADTESAALGEIGYEEIAENIAALSPVLRDIATLHFVHDWNAEEIAEFMEISRNSVYVGISRARAALLKKMRGEHYEL